MNNKKSLIQIKIEANNPEYSITYIYLETIKTVNLVLPDDKRKLLALQKFLNNFKKEGIYKYGKKVFRGFKILEMNRSKSVFIL